MDLTRWRVWQWMLIGLLAGAAVGFALALQTDDLDQPGDVNQFRALVRAAVTAIAQKQPLPIRNVVVRGPQIDPSKVPVYTITYEAIDPPSPRFQARQAMDRLRQTLNGAKPTAPVVAPATPQFKPGGIYATTPFANDKTVLEYLTQSGISFSNRTGSGQYLPVYSGAAAGFVGIGILWPGLIRLLVAVGLATPRPAKVKAAKQYRTGEDVDEMLTQPAAKTIDHGALDKLNDAMQAHLAATLPPADPRTAKVDTVEPVSILMSGSGSRSTTDPTDQLPHPEAHDEKKDYGGEYYPVARVIKKADDTHPPTDADHAH